MIGVGAVINVGAIIVGGLAGTLFGSRISTHMRASLTTASAIAAMFIGAGCALDGMLSAHEGDAASGRALLIVISLVVATLIGEAAKLERGIERVGEYPQQRTDNSSDDRFVGAFVTASVTVCVGAMAIVGTIEDGISGDHSILAVKAVLDFVEMEGQGLDIARTSKAMCETVETSVDSVGLAGDIATVKAKVARPEFGAETEPLLNAALGKKTAGLDLETLDEQTTMNIFMDVMDDILASPDLPKSSHDLKFQYIREGDGWKTKDEEAVRDVITENFTLEATQSGS